MRGPGLIGRLVDLASLRRRERRASLALALATRRSIREVRNYEIAKVSGTLHVVGEPIVAPLSGRACAHYSISVERPGELLVLDEAGTDFFLDDGSGVAYVHAPASVLKVVLDKDRVHAVGPFEAIARDEAAFLRWHGQVRHHILGFAEPLLFREGVLEAGELVTAVGVGTWSVDPDPNRWSVGYRDFPRKLDLGPLPGGALYVSDLRALATG